LRLRRGQNVLVYAAAGGMGNALIELAKAAGLTVIGVVGSADKARFARELGADHVINRKREMVGERVAEITHGRGVDAIIDPGRAFLATSRCSRRAVHFSSMAHSAARHSTTYSRRCV
jgi:NADPH2:quinone reductase